MNQSAQPAFTILKVAACPSLSGRSMLTYHLGLDHEAALHFRIFANSSSGYFNVEWVPMAKILEVLNATPLITSFTMQAIFKGKSQNNGGFLLAALLAEKLVEIAPDNERCYRATNGEAFQSHVALLIAEGINLDANTKPKVPRKHQTSKPELPNESRSSEKESTAHQPEVVVP